MISPKPYSIYLRGTISLCVFFVHLPCGGAIALVLCWELGDWVDEIEGPGTKEMPGYS